ncbi:hypothetical protein [Pantoea sp. Taur]|uniref:hypothetical protein n=1 Tax=Pantoea sp. Taur TaxID=2576757 RepID=UPI001354A47F|nr:hypothetical protein [Pantoea sp. Taur]MXP57877.1 hypothetical protein [Pantoea sp. Taur]
MRDFDMRRQHRRDHHFGGHRMMKPLLLGVVIIAALGLLVMSLWNAVLPAIIGVKAIGFWQALGLLVLCRILFGGLGFRPGMFGMARRRMHERWMQMTPEQREEFMQHRRERSHRGRRDRCDWHGRRGDARSPSDETPAKSSDAE